MVANKCHQPSCSRQWRFDVFLSFRGKDTRKTFTDHLFIALKDAGIHVFRDDNELPIGENISIELLEAIRGSRISVIVLSKDYAASSWCLEELANIMECRKTIKQVVFPIFYKVDPSDLRKHKRSYEEAFAKHDERFMAEKEKVLRWRDALSEAANLKGFHCTLDRHEGDFIMEIVDEILNHMSNTYLNEAIYPVGLESRMQEMSSLFSVGSNDVRIIGIYGMGGMGKTTIAKSVYNYFFHCFKHKSFLANVRESSKQPNGQVHLQEQLLYDILNKKIELTNVDRGINVIKERLCNKRVLIVLDDVDRLEQLSALTRKRDWFGLGSRIIITTRDEHLLKEIEADDIYIVKEMNHKESLKLFSWHAFRRSHPKENYVELSKDVVHYCKGLPLALEVVGSFLFERSAAEWKSALDKLKRIPHDQIQKKLRISFDALEDDKEKDIFLDIACFFIGMDKDYAATILDGCGFYAEIGISVLIRRCLLTINQCNELAMHDLLRDMGRKIVHEESHREPGNCSRLWFYDDVLEVLNKHKGTKAIEGLILKLSTTNEEHLSTEAFANMCNLRLLQLNYVRLTGSYDQFSKELRWVCWHGFPLKFIPKNFHLENLVVLDMQYSNLRQFSMEIKVLRKLKALNLSHSQYLIKTPNFSQAPNLEKLELENCTSLIEVHPSIGDVHRLIFLNLRGCKQLKTLPTSICMLKALEILNLSGCSKFERLPKDIGNMVAMIELLADETAVRQVPASIVQLKNIKNLSLCGCRGLTSSSLASILWSWVSRRESPNSISLLPPSLLGLTSLTRLGLKDCNLSDEALPKDIWSLSSLENLDLSGNNFCSLPASISKLSKLEKLELNYCTRLLSVRELPASLKVLSATYCNNFYSLPACFSNLPKLGNLALDYCTRLQSLPELPPSLCHLSAINCISLERLPNVSKLQYSACLDLMNCPKLIVIPGLEELIYDLNIDVRGCNSILASTLKETMPQTPGCVFLNGSEIPSRFHHQSMGSSLSLEVPRCFEDAVLDVCIIYAYNTINSMCVSRCGGLVLRSGDNLEIVIRPRYKEYIVKKCGVHLYDQFEGKGIQSNDIDVNEILHNSASNETTLVVGGGSDGDVDLPQISGWAFSQELYFPEHTVMIFDVDIHLLGDKEP